MEEAKMESSVDGGDKVYTANWTELMVYFRLAVQRPNNTGFGNLRTGELVICELIVRTTDANLGYNANQKLFMQLKEAHIRAWV